MQQYSNIEPSSSISHFAMNIIRAKTFSTAQVHFAKCHNLKSNPPKYLAIKISSHTVFQVVWLSFTIYVVN